MILFFHQHQSLNVYWNLQTWWEIRPWKTIWLIEAKVIHTWLTLATVSCHLRIILIFLVYFLTFLICKSVKIITFKFLSCHRYAFLTFWPNEYILKQVRMVLSRTLIFILIVCSAQRGWQLDCSSFWMFVSDKLNTMFVRLKL